MLGGHERDRRRARLGLRLSGASLTIRHGLARFPWDGWIGLFNLGPLAPPQRNTRLLVTLIIAAVVAVDGAIAVIVIITGGSPSGRIRAISHEPRQRPELHRSASVTIIDDVNIDL